MTNIALRPAWTPMTITLMVAGFVLFWPLGLAMLAYIIWGDRFHDFMDRNKSKFDGRRSDGLGFGAGKRGGFTRTGNLAFDEYREAELRRLEEERRKLDEERYEFETFVQELRRVKDKEEFDRFMSNRAKQERAASAETSAPKSKRRKAKDDDITDL